MESIYFQSGEVSHGIKHYMVDTENDKLKLPRDGMLGNRCYVIATKKWYILDGSGEWVPFAAEGGSVDADAILSVIDGMSDSEKSQLRSDLGIASVFTFKGVVEEVSDLPNIGNSAGDVYLVNENSSEYVWVITNSVGSLEIGRWEVLGPEGSGGEPELYIVTITRPSEYVWTADHTYSEINAAYTDGKSIVFKFGTYIQFAGKGSDAGSYFFRAIMIADGVVYSISVVEQYGVMGSEYSTTTPAGVVAATANMTTGQKTQTCENLGIQSSGITDDVKQALLNAFENVGWKEGDGREFVDALEAAMYPLSYITAVYTQSGTVYDTDSLDSLKADLVVTAFYQGGDSKTITYYTLNGALTEGESTITVSYGGKTTTFDVTVTAHPIVGWYYPFNGSLLSDGTEDFGFVGQEVFAQGRDGRQCYSHIIPTSGDSTTDTQGGLKAVSLSRFPDFNGDFTIAYWYSTQIQSYQHPIYFTKSQGSGTPANQFFSNVSYDSTWTGSLSKNGNATAGIAIQGAADGRLILRMTSANTNTSAMLTLNIPSDFDTTAWHHYAITKKGTTVRFFVDGTLMSTATLTGASIYKSNQLAITTNFSSTADSDEIGRVANGGKMQDLYIAEFCKWEDSFDASGISY